MKRTHSTAAASLALLLALTGCASASGTGAASDPKAPIAAPASLDALVTAAKAEGTVRVYSSLPEVDQQKLVDGFTAEYGIAVESLRLGGNTLPTRFDAETSAGTPSGEVLLSTALDFLLVETENGTLVPFEDTGVADLLPGLPESATLDEYAGIPIFQVLSTGYLYNTEMVTPAELPETWEEFVASDLADQACAVAPDTSESLMIFMAALRASDGDDLLAALGERVNRWYPSVIPMNEAVASGECAIGLNSAEFFAHAMKGQGAAVEFAPAPSAAYPVVSGAVASNAEHPNAARLFLHYALSEDGGTAIQDPEVGSFGAFDADAFPSDFAVMSPVAQREAIADSAAILRVLGF